MLPRRTLSINTKDPLYQGVLTQLQQDYPDAQQVVQVALDHNKEVFAAQYIDNNGAARYGVGRAHSIDATVLFGSLITFSK